MHGPLHIALTLTAGYLPYGAVTVASVCRYLAEGDRVRVYILHGGDITEKDSAGFLQNIPYGQDLCHVRFIRVNDHFDFSRRAARFSVKHPAAYYRLYIPELFPHLNRILYLDADLVVCCDPRPLYEQDMKGYALAGVEDAYSRTQAQCLFLPEDAAYVNGGVLLWNLQEIRRETLTQDLTALLRSNYVYLMNASDQDLLALLFREGICYLDPAWNVQVRGGKAGREESLALCGLHNNMSREICLRAFQHPYIEHYVQSVKPWAEEAEEDSREPRWFSCARLTGYYEALWKQLDPASGPDAEANGTAAAPVGKMARKPRSVKTRDPESKMPVQESRAEHDRKVALRNTLLSLNAEKRRSLPFNPQDIHAGAGQKVASTYHQTYLANGGNRDLYRLLFQTGSIGTVSTPADAENTDIFAQGFFRDDIALDEQIALYNASSSMAKTVFFVETANITSILNESHDYSIPLKYRRRYGFIIDDLSFYFDAVQQSRLEMYLNSSDSALSDSETERCRKLIQCIVNNRLTKYNFQNMDMPKVLFREEPKVLVADQSPGDASITRGMAGGHSFTAMLEAALKENPDAHIFIKTHPDSLTGLASAGYYAEVRESERVHLLTEAVNPHAVLDHVDVVYACTTQLGFEALMAGKRVVVFGMPIYAGWGLTDDRIACPRRTRKLTLEELFYGLYIKFCIYCNPYKPETCSLEEFLEHMIRLRAEYWEYLAKERRGAARRIDSACAAAAKATGGFSNCERMSK